MCKRAFPDIEKLWMKKFFRDEEAEPPDSHHSFFLHIGWYFKAGYEMGLCFLPLVNFLTTLMANAKPYTTLVTYVVLCLCEGATSQACFIVSTMTAKRVGTNGAISIFFTSASPHAMLIYLEIWDQSLGTGVRFVLPNVLSSKSNIVPERGGY